jgi:hypothetical protein
MKTVIVNVTLEPPPRECGMRYENAVYWALDLGPGGRPIDDFFFDPPVPVPDDVLAATPSIGVHWLERNGVWHLVDRVGLDNYPNPADVYEETARLGLSRRLPKTLDFSRLTAASRLLVVHDRALVANWQILALAPGVTYQCPTGKHVPMADPDCIGQWWETLTHAEPVSETDPFADPRAVTRHMATFDYQGRQSPAGMEPERVPGFIGSFPATRLEVIAGDESQAILERVSEARLPCAEVPQ